MHSGWVFHHQSRAIRSRNDTAVRCNLQLESEVLCLETTIVNHTETSKDRGHVIVAGDSPPGTVGRVEKLWVRLQPLPPKQK